jgi:uncharacterized membrane protein
MIAYHACWDIVYLFGTDWGWYRSEGAYLWQQSICWTFILLSGYCFHLGKHRLKHGLKAFGGGLLITAVTMVTMPSLPVLWGVLSLLGSAALLTMPLDKLFLKIPARVGFAASFCLFLLLRDVNAGFVGFEGARLLALPESLYANLFTAYLGFPGPGFRSSDYFALLPWVFLFWTGYFLYRLRPEDPRRGLPRIPVVTFMGRHSLLIYLLHQPAVYAVLTVWFWLF